MTAAFAALPRGRVLQYHNITPRALLRGLSTPRSSGSPRSGRQDLASRWRATSTWRLAIPSTTATNSRPWGSRQPASARSRSTSSASRRAAASRARSDADDGLTNFLFVGRIVPNKRIEDIVRLAEVYKRYIDATIASSSSAGPTGCRATMRRSARWSREFDMLPDRFLFPGAVTDWELAAYYRSASVYLSLSEHEGFCVPLLEAMAAGVPVFAYESTRGWRDAGRRRRVLVAEGSRVRGRAAGPACLRPGDAREGDRRPVRNGLNTSASHGWSSG